MTRMMARLSALAAATGGVSAIEFALIAAFLILPLTIGVYDFSTAMYRWMEVGNAARAGAEYANSHGFSSAYSTTGKTCTGGSTDDPFTCAIQATTNLPVTGANPLIVQVDPNLNPNPYCGCQFGSTFNAQQCSPLSANGGCPAGQTPVTMGQFTAAYTYKPIFDYLGIGPSNGFNLSAQATALIY